MPIKNFAIYAVNFTLHFSKSGEVRQISRLVLLHTFYPIPIPRSEIAPRNNTS